MLLKQLSVFVENKSGRLSEITRLLAENGINLRALSIADTTKFGILRIIVDKPALAVEILKEAEMTVNLTDVLAISISDKPGGLAKPLELLYEKGIGIEYMYAFIGNTGGKAYVILRVENNDAAIDVLTKAGISLLRADEIYTL